MDGRTDATRTILLPQLSAELIKKDMRWILATSAQNFILNLPPPKIYSENNNATRFTEVFSAHAHPGSLHQEPISAGFSIQQLFTCNLGTSLDQSECSAYSMYSE
jgi:hypothetical protein